VGIEGHGSVAFPVVRTPVPMVQEVDWGLRVGLDWYGEEKIFALTGDETQKLSTYNESLYRGKHGPFSKF